MKLKWWKKDRPEKTKKDREMGGYMTETAMYGGYSSTSDSSSSSSGDCGSSSDSGSGGGGCD